MFYRIVCLFFLLACHPRVHATPTVQTVAASSQPMPLSLGKPWVVVDTKLQEPWQDWGWAPHEQTSSGIALDLSQYGGWVLSNTQLPRHFMALSFYVQTQEPHLKFLEVCLLDDRHVFDCENITTPKANAVSTRVVLNFDHVLNPFRAPFTRIRFRASQAISKHPVVVSNITLYEDLPGTAMQEPQNTKTYSVHVPSLESSQVISTHVYGVAYTAETQPQEIKQLGATIVRWGGNTTSRYNFEHGNASNTGSDWFFMNVAKYNGNVAWRDYLNITHQANAQAAVTLPLLGWVAKDTSSYSFSIQKNGPQDATEPNHSDIGNGEYHNKPLKNSDPKTTSIEATPAFTARFAKALEQHLYKPTWYFLDNEPMLWHSTHRDVHPEPLGYDELWERTKTYASAIRAIAPHTRIAGPCEWGWPAYFYSAIDAQTNYTLNSDRLAHQNKPLLEWYLEQVYHYETLHGISLVNDVDVHFYPQANHVYQNGSDEHIGAQASALRIRSTRSLYDKNYVDESWIDEPIYLIPRLREMVARRSPGKGIVIGEYNFGAPWHISGGLAQLEALAHMVEQGVSAAFYWTQPPLGSPAAAAFQSFANYNGQGDSFSGMFIRNDSPSHAPVYLARLHDRIVMIASNLDAQQAKTLMIYWPASVHMQALQQWFYSAHQDALTPAPAFMVRHQPGVTQLSVLPYSWVVVELKKT